MQRVENWRGMGKNQSSEGPKSRSGALLATQNDQRDVQEAPKGSQQVNEGIKAFPKCSFWGLCHLLGSVFCILGVVWGPKERSKKRRKCEKRDFEAARRRDQKYIEETMKKVISSGVEKVWKPFGFPYVFENQPFPKSIPKKRSKVLQKATQIAPNFQICL